jgi:hypothetical protein
VTVLAPVWQPQTFHTPLFNTCISTLSSGAEDLFPCLFRTVAHIRSRVPALLLPPLRVQTHRCLTDFDIATSFFAFTTVEPWVVDLEICDCEVQSFGTPSIAQSASANALYKYTVIRRSRKQGKLSHKDFRDAMGS